jgi:glyoxylase-like metal-dependent hydrolase (beta-lactamase superfamily II)
MNVGIGILELRAVVENEEMVYRPTIIWDEKDFILIDTGLPGMLQQLLNNSAKLPISRLNKIIITHQDYDHIGSIAEIVDGFKHKIEVYAAELTKPYIEGKEPLIKKGFTILGTQVDHIISDNQVLPFCGGISIIFTPGHTPDHISLYHHSTKTLITGDALTTDNGQLRYPNKKYTLDMEQAIQSISRFLDYKINRVFCYHGGICKENIKECLSTLASGK